MYLFRLLCFGIVIHLIFLVSIFDIYFKSPVVADISPQPNPLTPLGKRVVLISVDGLRVDSLFDLDPASGKPVAEFVQNVIKTRGTWGVSQSHVPTESRPGHVAMLAGFYEDPSAVTRGWKENPVDFDSVFNRSRCSFAWGSPDILQIFFKGLKHDCAFMESYKNEQNFAGDTREYDNWVYEKLQEFLKFSKNSFSLYEEGIFFFLHLLGQDTSGHADKPHTEKYRLNLQNVDRLVKNIEKEFNDFYGDDKTTFIFTSDHGMTDWGSHGAGDLEEINTPFVAWGAGIKKPSAPPKPVNIDQADITPLLAILLGSPIPVNSVGVLPISYLNMSKKQIAEAVFLNAKQIVAQYSKLLQNTQENIFSFFHVPFSALLPENVLLKISAIQDAIHSEKYSEAIFASLGLIDSGLKGLSYYHNYYQKPLLYCISFSYLGWIFYLLLELLGSTEGISRGYKNFSLDLVFYSAVIVTICLIAMQRLPALFYAYALLPEILWYLTIRKTCSLQAALGKVDRAKFFYFLLSVFFAVEVLVLSFFYRWCLCLSMGFIMVWSVSSLRFRSNQCLLSLWCFSGLALGFFSLLPVVGGQPNPLLTASSGVCLCLVSLGSFLLVNPNVFLFTVRFLALAFATCNNHVVHTHFNENQELLDFNKNISWFLLVLSVGLAFCGKASLHEKLYQVFISLSVPFLLLSIKQEGFFLLFLFIHLICWIYVEVSAFDKHSTMSLFRIAYFFLAYIFLSFFGLGNISSLNSFDPAWVRCFLTVFSPFLMSALILLKTIIPFLVVTCTLRVIIKVLNIKPERVFIIVLIYCNIMALNFLFLVRNTGSWLDIGTSISHYVIQQVTIVFLVLLFGIAQFLTKDCPVAKPKDNNYVPGIKLSKSPGRDISLPTFYRSKQHKS